MTSTPPAPYGDYQFEIYAAGLGGVVPALPMAYPSLGDLTPDTLRRVTVPGD